MTRGGLVAFPTETVYGLGADAFDERAIAKIFEAKGRPSDNPLIVHLASTSQLSTVVSSVGPEARDLIDTFMPGPLTVVLPRKNAVPEIATAGLDSVGVRVPGLSLTREFLTLANVPVVAPSANMSGRPSPTTWQAVHEDLDGRIDCILQGGSTEIGLESTVVDCTGPHPILLRQGAISLEQLQTVVASTVLAGGGQKDAPRSPGLKHKHYSPRARIALVNSPSDAGTGGSDAYIGLSVGGLGVKLTRHCPTVEEYAQSLFEFFRECDRQGVQTIFCERVDEIGIGAALMDRLNRAAKG